LLLLGASGCVQRRFTVRTNPPGAVLYVDDNEIGVTPASHDFVYYGVRKIRLVKDGYETLTVLQPIPAPWYQFIGLDFITENLIPGEIRDERVLDFQMQPQIIVPTEQLLSRAENLRQGTQAVAPLPPPAPRRQWFPRLLPWQAKPPGAQTLPQSGVNGLQGSEGNELNSGAEPIDPHPTSSISPQSQGGLGGAIYNASGD
jgi:hypothetical protein